MNHYLHLSLLLNPNCLFVPSFLSSLQRNAVLSSLLVIISISFATQHLCALLFLSSLQRNAVQLLVFAAELPSFPQVRRRALQCVSFHFARSKSLSLCLLVFIVSFPFRFVCYPVVSAGSTTFDKKFGASRKTNLSLFFLSIFCYISSPCHCVYTSFADCDTIHH
jgi:hypothetical protein